MFRKSILAALAVASLGAIAVSTTDASAFAHFGGRGFARASFARVGTPRIAFRQNFAIRRIIPVYHAHWRWRWRWHFAHYRPYWVAPVVATSVATSYSAPTGTCNCLTKQYTPNGAVVFKDVCTNEMAMNPPAVDPAPQAPASLQTAPMQQGYLQPQPAQ